MSTTEWDLLSNHQGKHRAFSESCAPQWRILPENSIHIKESSRISRHEPRVFCYTTDCVQLLQWEIHWDHVELSPYLMNILRVQTTLLLKHRFLFLFYKQAAKWNAFAVYQKGRLSVHFQKVIEETLSIYHLLSKAEDIFNFLNILWPENHLVFAW